MEVRSKYLKTFRYMQTIVGSEDSSVLGNVDAYLLCFQEFQQFCGGGSEHSAFWKREDANEKDAEVSI